MELNITRGKQSKAQKVVIYGPEGIGKTLFCANFPNPLFIDTEGSTTHIDVARLPAPTSWAQLIEEVKYIKENPHLCTTLVIDTLDWAEQLCSNNVCKKKGVTGIEDIGYGKGYVYLAEDMGRLLNLLQDVVDKGVNVAITAHAQMRKFEQPDEMGAYDRWELKLQKKTAPLLKEWADMLLFANYKTMVVNVDNQGATKGKNKAQGKKRIIYTDHHPCWDAKNRHGLPEEIPLDFAAIARCIPSRREVLPKTETPAPAPASDPVPVPAQVQKEDLEEQEQKPAEKISAPIELSKRYWHNAKYKVVFTSENDEEDETYKAAPDIVEIAEREYNRLLKEPGYNAANKPNHNKDDHDEYDGLPKALSDLMRINNVTQSEVRRAVSSKGYYPEDTPISNYDEGFIDGCLIGAWEQVYGIIAELREVENKFGGKE